MSNTQPYIPDYIQRIIVIRAAVFNDEGNIISDIVTNSFLIQSLGVDNHALPVVSICADTAALFDYENGILVPGIHYNLSDTNWTGNYYNEWKNWERKCNIEYYIPNKAESINQIASLRTENTDISDSRNYERLC